MFHVFDNDGRIICDSDEITCGDNTNRIMLISVYLLVIPEC